MYVKFVDCLPYLLILNVVACGGADFSGGSSTSGSKGKDSDAAPNGLSIVWEWPCSVDASSKSENDTEIILKGPGPHHLDFAKVDGAPVYFKGDSCGAQKVSRDVVFAIDVSGSMSSGPTRNPTGTDPLVNGSCARFQALENVMSSILKTSDTRFGVVTFHTGVEHASTKLHSNKADLYAELLAQGKANSTIQELICAGIDGTNYDDGLEKAGKLLDTALEIEKKRAREIYFISDGLPDPVTANGQTIASILKKNTTIATVMVGSSNDNILKNFVASKDHLGAPLHARAEFSSKLADVLAKLSVNAIVNAELIYGGIGADGKKMNIGDKITGDAFNFKAFNINTSDALDGIAVEFKYKDRFGTELKSVGELRWNAP